ncbi:MULTISPECIES: helix-turn-helix transcriptional regulator [unclassified Acidisoma]|jgi:DNA-binding transcriptional ArsR family regulator|uniref:ArsR/SmtB family transcription factor n=1 Tax=unclassified Acidisoma TaxID=2634065 RepID=UPI00131BE046|nr:MULTISPECIES: helix-turn-helix transcriptional regulator [unclassified Acidisoma]
MSAGLPISEIGALVGDPGRANMLSALFDGRALTASELAWSGGVAASTASEHLAKLVAGGLISVAKQGRHRYFRLASPEIARMLESMMVVANNADPAEPRRRATPRIAPNLRRARTCYDHLAGQLGVGIADRLVAQDIVVLGDEAGELTQSGLAWLERFGIAAEPSGRTRRLLCRPCLDWSERRPHLAGRLGAALCRRCGELGWIERERDSRAVLVTPSGLRGFAEVFGLSLA